jgi:hypothetical protein
MFAILLLALHSASQPSCLDAALRDIPKRGPDAAFRYSCITEKVQSYRATWDSAAVALTFCPEAREIFKTAGDKPQDALRRTGDSCGTLHAKQLEGFKASEALRIRDSLKEVEKERKDVERRKSTARNLFATRRTAIQKALLACIRQEYKDLDSLQLDSVESLDQNLYRVVWKAKTSEGNEETTTKKVTLENNVCFFEDDLPETPEE